MGKFNTYADAPEEARLAKERWERQQKNAPRTGSAVVDTALRLFDDSTRKLEGGQQLQDYAAGKIDSTQINEEQRPIGSKAILNGKEVYWAGQNYGYQSKGSYDKLMEEGQFRMGQIAGQRLGSDIVSAISPEAKQAVQSGIETAVQAGVDLYYDSGLVRDAVNALQPTLQVVGGGIRLADRGLEAVSRITNTSRFITDEAVMALATGGASAAARRAGPVVKKGLQAIDKALPTIDDFTGPGSGMALAGAGPQLTMRGGSVNLQPPTVMKAVTTTVPEALEAAGVRTGDELMDARLGKQYTKRNRDVLAKENDIKYLKETLAGLDELKNDPKNLIKFINKNPELLETWNRYTKKYGADEAFSRTRANIAQRKTNADTAWSQLKSNVLPFEKDGEYRRWYGSDAAKPDRRRVETALRVKGDLKIKEYLQQHHLIPKGMTAAYFNKMDQLIAAGKAKPDDLIVMAQVALKKGMPTGDVKANLKDLIPAPHAELHTILRRQGDEIAKSKLIKDLSKINNVDDLMRLWVKEFSPEGKFTYNYETAKIFQELDSLLEEMTGISKNVRKRDVKEK